jgi:branched-chain amino acid transport system permease protein
MVAFIIQIACTAAGTEYFLTQIIMSAYYSLVIIGLCLLMGYAGQISLGQAGFFAVGGYTQAFLTTVNLSQFQKIGIIALFKSAGLFSVWKDVYGNNVLSFSSWFAFLIAILITIGIAFLIGIPVLRLKGHYLAMATLGFGIIITTIVKASDFLGKADGITNVPPFILFTGIQVCGQTSFRVLNYYIAWVFVFIALIIAMSLINSRVGRALRAIHGSEEAASAMGIDTARYKLYTFILGAVFASVGGIFLTHYNGGIGPSETYVIKSIRYVSIVAIGGMDNISGSLVMGLVLNFLSLRGYFGSYDDLVFGIILVVVMIFFPKGLLRAKYLRRFFSVIREKTKSIINKIKSGKEIKTESADEENM